MNQFALNKLLENHDSICGDLLAMADKELKAIYSAVTELFGSDQAEAAAEDWLHELMATNDLPASTRQWRLLTVKVLTRLANRVNASSLSTVSRTFAYSE
jgi:hypothetical protein